MNTLCAKDTERCAVIFSMQPTMQPTTPAPTDTTPAETLPECPYFRVVLGIGLKQKAPKL